MSPGKDILLMVSGLGMLTEVERIRCEVIVSKDIMSLKEIAMLSLLSSTLKHFVSDNNNEMMIKFPLSSTSNSY